MKKSVKITVPEGYEIDKEESTFENIVFRKKGYVIKWNTNYNGVEINADGEHFIVDANPSYYMNWEDAMRFYRHPHRNHTWILPTVRQLKVLAKYIEKVNEVIRENNGYEINGCLWSCEEENKLCAWRVRMYYGYTSYNNKYIYDYVRAVSAFEL